MLFSHSASGGCRSSIRRGFDGRFPQLKKKIISVRSFKAVRPASLDLTRANHQDAARRRR